MPYSTDTVLFLPGALGNTALWTWGDADLLSPVAVGHRLAELFPGADLLVVPGGAHDLVSEHAQLIVPRIDRHLQR